MPPWFRRFISWAIGIGAGMVANPATFGLGATKEMSMLNIGIRLGVVFIVYLICSGIIKKFVKKG